MILTPQKTSLDIKHDTDLPRIREQIHSLLSDTPLEECKDFEKFVQEYQNVCQEQFFPLFNASYTEKRKSIESLQVEVLSYIEKNYPKLALKIHDLLDTFAPHIQESIFQRLGSEYLIPLLIETIHINTEKIHLIDIRKLKSRSWLGTKGLPKFLLSCKKVNALYVDEYLDLKSLTQEQITTLAPHIAHIDTLDLFGDFLFDLEQENLDVLFSEVHHLRNLSLLKCPLNTSPQKIQSLLQGCTHIRSLNWSYKKGTIFDNYKALIKGLKNLKHLRISGDDFGNLPQEFSEIVVGLLPQLESLAIVGFDLTQFPESLITPLIQSPTLKAFEYHPLSDQGHSGCSLVKNFLKAQGLRYLEIKDEHPLAQTPQEYTTFFEGFPFLRHLSLVSPHAPLKGTYQAIGQGCKNIFSLSFERKHFNNFSAQDAIDLISPLSQLRHLSLDRCEFVIQDDDFQEVYWNHVLLKSPINVKVYEEKDWKTSDLILFLGSIPKLETLTLKHTNLDKLPSHILKQAFDLQPQLRAVFLSPECARAIIKLLPELKDKIFSIPIEDD